MAKNDYLPLPTTDAPAAGPAKRDLGWKVKVGLPLVVLFVLLSALGTGMVACGKDKGMMDGMGMGMHGDAKGMGMGIGMHGEGHMGMSKGMTDMMSGMMTPSSLAAHAKKAACPAQPAPRVVGDDWEPAKDEEYAKLAASRLSAAVKLHTVSYDDLPADAKDPRFDDHYAFADWMEKTYPSVYAGLEHEMVNTHAHLFTWKGSKSDQTPIMLMAHEDTVPVNPSTEDQWTYPPWSGEITHDASPDTPGTWIWGRGSSDCKNSLTGILGAVEKLLSEGYTPERDVLIAYGFDEEVSSSMPWWLSLSREMGCEEW